MPRSERTSNENAAESPRTHRAGRVAASGLALVLVLAAGALLHVSPAPTEAENSGDAALSSEERQNLESLGYIDAAPIPSEDAGKSGVTRHDPKAAFRGYNLFNSRNESRAQLLDMEGRLVHEWKHAAEGKALTRMRELVPTLTPSYLDGWGHFELQPDGDLLVIRSHHLLMRLDARSNLEWKLDISAHHDLDVAENGELYVLTDEPRVIEFGAKPLAVQDTHVVVVSADGEVQRSISLFDALQAPAWRSLLEPRLREAAREQTEVIEALVVEAQNGDDASRQHLELYRPLTQGLASAESGVVNILLHNTAADIFHANAIQLLRGDAPGLWSDGDLLLTILKLDAVVVLDMKSLQITRVWGRGFLQAPHHATQLADDTLLVFDNGARRGYSRVLRIEPQSRSVVWQYGGDPPKSFFTRARGGAQLLPNGNVLITESNRGHAFEVTPAKTVVWEYFNPDVSEQLETSLRGTIYRLTRIAPDGLDWRAPQSAADASGP